MKNAQRHTTERTSNCPEIIRRNQTGFDFQPTHPRWTGSRGGISADACIASVLPDPSTRPSTRRMQARCPLPFGSRRVMPGADGLQCAFLFDKNSGCNQFVHPASSASRGWHVHVQGTPVTLTARNVVAER